MKTFDIIRLALLNLHRRMSRTLLTVVGVVIGTACIVVMVAIGLTNLREFESMLGDANLTTIEVMGRGEGQSLAGSPELNDASGSGLCRP